MDPEQTPMPECDQLLHRLRRAEGQLRAVITMIEERQDCKTVATQMAAAKAAVEKAAMLLVLQLADPDTKLPSAQVSKLALPLA